MVEIRLSGLSHEFDEREVLRSIDFTFDGLCLAVTGPNGSGKSTLLRILAGLLTPTSGHASVIMNGAEVPREALRHLAGLAAPDVRLYAELTPRENLSFLMRARTGYEPGELVDDTLRSVGLLHRADDPVSELSSGLRQRACLAAALVHSPALLLLDEPSSNLDEEGVGTLREVIREQAERGMVVIATNDRDEAELATVRLDLGGRT